MVRKDIPTVIHSNVYGFSVMQELPPVNITKKFVCNTQLFDINAKYIKIKNTFLQQ